MRIHLVVSVLVVGLMSLLTQGCLQTCDHLCSENALYIQGCLESWDAQWSDLGYDGRVQDGDTSSEHPQGPAGEYVETCRSRYSVAISRSELEAQRVVRQGCSEDLQLLASSVGCDDYEPNDLPLDPNEN
ncbi:MAG: hypothetical protein VX498_12005 [Myxococcota bacterium]|nr:hypothetical protein [Myxococcota bacterium]